jgi:hypothetical protein
MMKVKIGSALIHRAQRYAHRDPAPHIPFAEEHLSEASLVGAYTIVATTLAVIVFWVLI